jgi:ABC-type glycerol-3-phosphate transport system permease component
MLVLVSALRWRRIAHMAGIAVVAFVGLETATAGILSGFQPAIVPALGLALGLRRRSESRSERPAATGTGLRYYGALRERLVSFRPGRRRGSADLHVAGMLWRIGQGTAALLYAVAVGIFLYLLLWISFSQVDSVFVDSVLPRFFGFGNYVALFDGGGFLRALGNSVMLAGSTALVATMISFMAGAAAAVFRHDGQSIFMGMEFFQLTGGIHSLVPLFALVVLLNAVNSYVPIVILYGAAAVPIGFYVLYGFLRQLPSSLYDAARIAGAGPFLYISRILLPLSRPALVNVVLLSWITAWNGFLIPLIFLTGEERFPVSVFLHNLVGTIASGTPSWGAFAAGSVVNILVLSILFVASRRPLQYDAVSELA